jgi:hypothetical protein
MPAAVPDDVLEQFVIAGTYDEIVDRIKERFAGVCTRVSLGIPVRTPEDEERLRAMIKALQDEREPSVTR